MYSKEGSVSEPLGGSFYDTSEKGFVCDTKLNGDCFQMRYDMSPFTVSVLSDTFPSGINGSLFLNVLQLKITACLRRRR